MHEQSIYLSSEMATEKLGQVISQIISKPFLIYLLGDLGAGKTTFARGFLKGLGHVGRVKSPTYTLIESYTVGQAVAHHLDLYRLGDAEELDFLGLRDFIDSEHIFLIEWPQRGSGWLPAPDLTLSLFYEGSGRQAKLDYNCMNLLGNLDISSINDT